MSKQTQRTKWKHTAKHHADVLKTMNKILKDEPYDAVMSDDKLAEAIKAEGVFASKAIVRKVRVDNGIGCSEERRITQFAKQYKGK